MGVFVFNCPHCGKPIGAQDEWEGKTSMCPHCQKPVVIRHSMSNPPPTAIPTSNGTTPPPSNMPPAMSGWDDYYSGPAAISENAKNSLWLAIAGICCCNICSIVAVVLGIMGLNEIKNSEGRLEGRGYAWAGIILGILPLIMLILQILFSTVFNDQFHELFDNLLNNGTRIEQYEEYNEESVEPLPEPKHDSNEKIDDDAPVETPKPLKEQQREKPRNPRELI